MRVLMFRHFNPATRKWTAYKESADPNNIFQYTGLLDMDGVRIYEGDIVRYRKRGIYVFRFFPQFGCYGMDRGDGMPVGRGGSSTKYEPYFMTTYHLRKILVVGNIVENPELVSDIP